MQQKIVNKKGIAILMAVYNGDTYLTQQLDSIIRQTNDDWNLFIRDDGSSDESYSILQKYEDKYDNITLVRDKLGNLGTKNVFLHLLEIVDSDYYMFCDQDDVWLHNKIELSIKRMKEIESEKGKEIPILVHSDVSLVDDSLNIIEKSYWKGLNLNPEKFKTYNYLTVLSFITGMTMLFNRISKDYIFPISKYSGMHDSWISPIIAKNGIISSIYQQTVLYRQHNNNVLGIKSKEQRKFFYKLNHLKSLSIVNYNRAKRISNMGFGSISKYFYYKFKIAFIRIISKYPSSNE